MKVKNPSGREYYIQRAKDDRMANWCSRVTPVILEFDGVQAEAYADPDRSDWIYIRFNETTYCNWAKKEGGFDLLTETTLRISDPGRTYQKRDKTERSETDDADRDEGSSIEMHTEDRSLRREDLDAVVSLLPALREAVAARADDPEANIHEYSTEFTQVVRKVVDNFHKRRFMYAFDYMSWMDEAERLTNDRGALATADLESLRKLLVVHWRKDYWDNDHTHWEWIAATGHLIAVLERMQELANQMEFSQKPPKSKFVWDDENAEGMDVRVPDDVDAADVWPTVEELMAGFDRIRDKITPQQMIMLQVNYYSGGRAATMRELATASGYGDYKIANIQYGGLAKRLYKAIGYPAPRSRNSDNTYWVLGLGEFIDRSDFGLEMQCVMLPEVAKALERLGIVEKTESICEELLDPQEIEIEELAEPNSVYAWEVDDLTEVLSESGSEINDFIVYHNPHTMGPMSDNPAFEVLTNKSVSGAKKGDRVWLITAEGSPRQFSLACWFYIDEFQSGEEEGFKHCVSGSEGKNFSPFVPIEPTDWFTQLKQDQGNFAFGFSKIKTPGAVEGLEALAHLVTDNLSFGTPDETTAMTLSQIEAVAGWHTTLRDAVRQERENRKDESYDPQSSMLEGTVKKMLSHFEGMNVFVEFDIGRIGTYGWHYAANPDDLTEANLMQLRMLLSYYVINSGQAIGSPGFFEENNGYWSELALNGPLLRILRIFGQIHNEVSAKTLVR